jgi:hypothetical protein
MAWPGPFDRSGSQGQRYYRYLLVKFTQSRCGGAEETWRSVFGKHLKLNHPTGASDFFKDKADEYGTQRKQSEQSLSEFQQQNNLVALSHPERTHAAENRGSEDEDAGRGHLFERSLKSHRTRRTAAGDDAEAGDYPKPSAPQSIFRRATQHS